MEIIDVLSTQNVILGIDERQNFTVVGVPPVDIPLNALVAGQGRLRTSNQVVNEFAPKDNITILSIGVVLPYNFVLSTTEIFLQLYWADGVNMGYLNIGSSQGYINIPYANYEFALSTYIPWPTPAVLPYWIIANISDTTAPVNNQTRISMLGVPAALVGATLPIIPFIKVAHNIPLV